MPAEGRFQLRLYAGSGEEHQSILRSRSIGPDRYLRPEARWSRRVRSGPTRVLQWSHQSLSRAGQLRSLHELRAREGQCQLSRPSLPVVLPSPSPGRAVRIEYLDYRDVDEHREYRFRVYGPDGSNEFRLRVANAAFDARRVRMQDGPDLCYQKLLRAIAAGVTAQPDVITIDDADLFSYRDDHTPVPKRRSWTPSAPATPAVAPRKQPQSRPRPPRTASPRPPVAAARRRPRRAGSSRRASASTMRSSEWA